MAVKILITRRFKPEQIGQANKLLMGLRALATVQKGYISGETLVSSEDPNKILVVSEWVSAQRWNEWRENAKRVESTEMLNKFLDAPEQVETYLVGEKMPEWVDMA